MKLFLPAGAELTLLGLIQVISPSGVCLFVRIPALGGNTSLQNLIQQVQAAGGAVELV
ncbi:hypothetical protein ASZ90_017674 [hydrocarbon metagenome]|uniref:Uncharacterized protein n=1 Tax=hydrocarbon metagenome TaxID=938273 RepID=A0A0W8E8H4_9ZZZZ